MMSHNIKYLAAGLAFFAAVAPLANAQVDEAVAVGQVMQIEGPFGSVLVVRGSETYGLATGDAVFEGDQIFARSNGNATVSYAGCEREIVAASSLTVAPGFCEAVPVTLAQDTVVGGFRIGAGGGIGATPALIGLLVAGGGAAAAAGGGGGGGAPASP